MPFVLAQGRSAFSGGLGGYLEHVGYVALFVLVLLVLFSLVSWAVIIYKGLALRRAHAQSRTFLDIFRKSSKFSEVNSVCVQLQASPLVGVFQAGYLEVNQQVRGAQPAAPEKPGRPTVKSLEALSRALVRAATVESTRLERRLAFLATTANVAPFIGLFGTTWGIMNAFRGIADQGSASLVAVAPGIAEALITTATGLGAAIPAAFFYNLYASRVKVLSSMVDDFALEFLNIVERNFT
ncbi:MAG TPA: MotA/TolQ/ExbB proton channel family protein [Vicinamibacteria bacterium]|nr:MotA/TolQ/ExbB proton channel family protein [Vicinamibacteria bacterium]